MSNFRRFSTIKIDQTISIGTVSAKDVTFYSNLANVWWDIKGPMKALHSLNKLRIPFIRDGLINSGLTIQSEVDGPEPLKGLYILDVGCGGGILAEPLSRLGCKVTGIDASFQLIDVAKQHAAKHANPITVNYEENTIENHMKANSLKYDAVVASEILQHVDNRRDIFISNCVKCLKPSGSIFITTVNQTYWSYISAILFGEYICNVLPQGTHDWNKFVAPHHVQRYLEAQKCKTKLIHGMCLNPFINKWYWIADKSSNYALQAVKMPD